MLTAIRCECQNQPGADFLPARYLVQGVPLVEFNLVCNYKKNYNRL